MQNDAIINVKDFGAVGKRTTDDWEPIQKAFDEIVALILDKPNYKYGRTLYFPSGHYDISKPILFEGDPDNPRHMIFRLRILGDGSEQSIIQQKDRNVDLFRFTQPSAHYVSFLNFDSLQLVEGRHAIYCDNFSYSTINNVSFRANGGVGKNEPSIRLKGNTLRLKIANTLFRHGGDIINVDNGVVGFVNCGIGEDVGNITVDGHLSMVGCTWDSNCVDRLLPDGLYDMGPASVSVASNSSATITGCQLSSITNGFLNAETPSSVNITDCYGTLQGGTFVRSRRLHDQRGVSIRGGHLWVYGEGNSLFEGTHGYRPSDCSIDGLRITVRDGAELTIDDAFLDPGQRNYYGINPIRYPRTD